MTYISTHLLHWLNGLLVGALVFFALWGVTRHRWLRGKPHHADIESRLRLKRTVLDSLPYPVFVKDSQLRYLVVNRAYEIAYGVSSSVLIGRTLQETAHLRDRNMALIEATERSVLSSSTFSQHEYETGDGAESTLVHLSPIRLPEWDMPGIIGTIFDITDFRKAERRARSAEQRLNDIADSLPLAVFEIRASEAGDIQVTYAAGDCLGTFGLTAAEVMADEATAFELVHPDDRAPIRLLQKETIEKLVAVGAADLRLSDGRGGYRWMRTAGGTPRRTADGGAEWSGYLLNVDDLYKQSAALEEARARAESASEAKSRFLAMMSHEIRTPMTAVLGLIELLEQAQQSREHEQTLRMMQSSASTLLQILDDILDYSRIESGNLTLETATFQPRVLIDDLVGLFSANAWARELVLYASVDWRVAPYLVGDLNRLRQILGNLLSNAVKFTERGHVALRVELLQDSQFIQRLRFVVEDTGIGIPAERKDMIFDSFVQGEADTARRFGGTGLGLAISRKLATLMGAELTLEGREAGGTVACLELNLPIRPTYGMEAGTSSFAGWIACVRIPERNLRLGFSNALSSIGFNVVEVSDTDNLSDIVHDEAHSLLVTDSLESPADEKAAVRHRLIVTTAEDSRGMWTTEEAVFVRGNAMHHGAVLQACLLACKIQIATDGRRPVYSRPDYSGLRVLVAEDNSANRFVLGKQLQRIGVEHTMVNDGYEALRCLDENTFDLLITDCHMPRIDGFQLTDIIRKREEGTGVRLPIVAVTASILPEELERCMTCGMDDTLSKPVKVADIERCLQRLQLNRLHRHQPVAGAADNGAGAGTFHDDRLALIAEVSQSRGELHELLWKIEADLVEGVEKLRHALEQGDEKRARELRHSLTGVLSYFLPAGMHRDMSELAHFEHWIGEIRKMRETHHPD